MFQCKEQDFDLLDVDRELISLELQGDALSPMAEAGSVIVTDLNRQIETGDAAVIFTYGEEQLAGIVSNIRDRSSGKLQGYMIHSLAPEDDNTRMISKADVFCAAPILATYADPEIFRSSYPTRQATCDESYDCASKGGLSGDNVPQNKPGKGSRRRVSLSEARELLQDGRVIIDENTMDHFRRSDGKLEWMLRDKWVTCHYQDLRNRQKCGYESNRLVLDNVLTADREQIAAKAADVALESGRIVTDWRSADQWKRTGKSGSLYVRSGPDNPWHKASHDKLATMDDPDGKFFVVGPTLKESTAASA